MKPLTIIACITGAALISLGTAMAITNLGPKDYEEFAAEQLSDYLEENFCDRTESSIANILQQPCKDVVKSVQPQLQTIISQGTQRQNYLLFSIYKTELSIASFLPAYEFETVGAFQNFYIYKAERK